MLAVEKLGRGPKQAGAGSGRGELGQEKGAIAGPSPMLLGCCSTAHVMDPVSDNTVPTFEEGTRVAHQKIPPHGNIRAH